MSSLNARLNAYAPYSGAALRIMSGLLFLEHGLQKVIHFPPVPPGGRDPGPFMPMSLPGVAGIIEVVAGVLITIGLFTRAAAFIASGEMAVAYFMVHAKGSPYPMNNGGDAAVLFCFIFLNFVFAGPGSFALDNSVGKRSAA